MGRCDSDRVGNRMAYSCCPTQGPSKAPDTWPRAGSRHHYDPCEPCSLCSDFQATTSTNWILESQNINELKSEINSLKGLLLNR